MKVYLSVPMINNRNIERSRLIAEIIEETGNTLASPWVLGEVESASPEGVNVFERDRTGAENCDMLIADVSMPSNGVGMEIMAAYYAGKKIVLLAKNGSRVSRMLLHMKRKEIIFFDDNDDLKNKLKEFLSKAVTEQGLG
ncbi:MAG: nucleoside 2-deoxyribosyltransferase [Conexivisphaerales archaeon]